MSLPHRGVQPSQRGSPERRQAYEAWHAGVEYRPEDDLAAPWHAAFARRLASLHPSLLVACDYSETAVRLAREFSQAPSFLVADIQHLPARPGAFDVVVSMETIEHVLEPRRGVAELGRVLARGGTLLLTTPNYLGIMGLFRAYKRLTGEPFTEVDQPLNKFVMLSLTTRWVRRAGLRVVEAAALHHYLPIPGRPPVRLGSLDELPILGWRTGLHSFVRAVK